MAGFKEFGILLLAILVVAVVAGLSIILPLLGAILGAIVTGIALVIFVFFLINEWVRERKLIKAAKRRPPSR